MVRSRWIGAVAGMLSCVAPVVVAQSPVMQANRVVQVREAGQNPRSCRVVQCWRESDGSRICLVEALDNGDKFTIYEPANGSTMRLFRGHAKAPTPVSPRPTTWAKRTGTATTTVPVGPSGSQPPAISTTVTQVELTPAKPNDWRQSWGPIESSSSATSQATPADASTAKTGSSSSHASTAEPAVKVPPLPHEFPTPTVLPEKGGKALTRSEEKAQTELPKGVTRVETAAKLPPVPGVGSPVPGEGSPTKVVTPLPSQVTPTGTPSTATPTTTGRPVKEGGLLGLGFKPATPGPKAPSVTTQEPPLQSQPLSPPRPRLAPGMASVLAATEEIRPGKSGVGNALSLPNPPAGPGIGVPTGAGNAFTPAVMHRPIPSDIGAGPVGMVQPPLTGPLPPLPPQPLPPAMQQQMVATAAAQHQAALAHMALMQQEQMRMQQAHEAALAAARDQTLSSTLHPQTSKLLTSLKEGLLPSERELAAEDLRSVDWKANPQVVEVLVQAAKSDPAPMVRVACIKTLGALKVTQEPVLQTLELLSVDQDVRIRNEAKSVREALAVKR